MMNELFVLGELMEGPQSGYQLRNLLQISLGRHRKISFGVIYPLLDKLARGGFITLTNEPSERNKKVVSITEKGKARFFEMMEQPVPDGAHNADIYLIKLDTMQHFPLDWQLELLDQFINEQNITINETKEAIEDLLVEECSDHWYAKKKLELRIQQSMVAKQWAMDFKQDLKNKNDILGEKNGL